MSDQVDLQEFVAGYLAEVDEHLSASTTNLLALDEAVRRHATNARAVRELFRSLHTIKGLSAMVGVTAVVDVAHAMESLLREADQAGGRISPAAVDLLVQGVRAIEQRVRQVAAKQPVSAAPADLLDALEAVRAPSEPGAAAQAEIGLEPTLLAKLAPGERQQLVDAVTAGKRAVQITFVPSPELAREGVNITSVRERAAKLADLVKVVPRAMAEGPNAPAGLSFVLLVTTGASDEELASAAAVPPAQVAGIPVAVPAPAPAEEAEAETSLEAETHHRDFVRVDVARLDEALERLSALVVTRFRLGRAVAELAARGVDVRALQEVVAENGRQLKHLRAAIMKARMVSVAEMLERVPLIVRGLRTSTGKRIRLEIDAGRTELDKAVAERLFPVIVHLVRNAVDHALESPEERQKLGKPEDGLVRVACHERSNTQLELTVTDDGRGIDAAAVARRAGRKVPETTAALLDLLATPGFSTRDEATTTSGRGLGVDIVRKVTVEQLGGELLLDTKPGRGTTFTLRVPLTITILDTFGFSCADQRFVVPVSAVEEIVDVEPSRVVRGPGRPGSRGDLRLLERRGEAVPLVALASLFALRGEATNRTKALVVRRNGEPFAFEVDRMLGQQEVVVRPLDDELVRITGVTGSSDLGDGKPTLVLDLVALSGTLLRSQAEAA